MDREKLLTNRAAAYRRVFLGEGPTLPPWKLKVLELLGVRIAPKIDDLSADAKIVLGDLSKFCGALGGSTLYPASEATHFALGKREVIDRIYTQLNFNPSHAMRLREHAQTIERDYDHE